MKNIGISVLKMSLMSRSIYLFIKNDVFLNNYAIHGFIKKKVGGWVVVRACVRACVICPTCEVISKKTKHKNTGEVFLSTPFTMDRRSYGR